VISKRPFLLATFGFIIVAQGCSPVRPLHRSQASIRASLLRGTPLGTPYKEVESFVRKEGWQWEATPYSPSTVNLRYAGTAGAVPEQPVLKTIHVNSFGYYWTWPFFERHVWASWLFDTNCQLIEVWVGKCTRGL
jgi:hypothetical protein